MNIRELQYLVALADWRHFGRAAEACFVSQPTLSTQVRKLEDELGVQLVERSPRRILLTEAGHEIAERARLILRDLAQIREVAKRTKDPEAGVVRLGIFPTLGPYLLPHVIPELTRLFPQLELLLLEEKTEDLLHLLKEGRLDAAILAQPVHEDGLHIEPLFEEPFVIAVPQGHPLDDKDSLNIGDLSGHTVLLLEDGHCLRDQALEVCQLASANEKPGFRATSLETLRQMVGANVGITLLPVLATKPPIPETATIHLKLFADPVPSRQLAMVWRHSTALGDFLLRLSEQFRQLPSALLKPEIHPQAPKGKNSRH